MSKHWRLLSSCAAGECTSVQWTISLVQRPEGLILGDRSDWLEIIARSFALTGRFYLIKCHVEQNAAVLTKDRPFPLSMAALAMAAARVPV